MKKITLISLFIGVTITLFSQKSDSLDINQIKASFLSGGDLFRNELGHPSFTAPKDSQEGTIYHANLWIGGIDGGGQLRMAGQTYRQSGTDFWHGPVANNYDSAFDATYDRVWKVNKTDIDTHLANWNSPGYAAPPVITEWPAHGDTANGEAWLLAPFVDLNNDQMYNPFQGDYPAIRGDQTVFFIFNDDRTIHTETGGEKLGFEIHGLAYAYNTPEDTALNHTIFVNYKVINRRGVNMPITHFGLWADLDIGYFKDDYLGTDTTLQMAYGYNEDNEDNDNPNYGYGLAPPAQGVTFLNVELDRTMAYKNDFSDVGNPQVAQHYYGYLTNYWKDGSALAYGGSGYDTSANATPSNYIFPGDPVAGTGWTAADSGAFDPGDGRILANHGPFEFGPSAEKCFDIAFTFARDTAGTNLSNVTLLKSHTAKIRDFFDQQNYSCEQILANIPTPVKPLFFNAFPNPVNDRLSIQLPEMPRNAPVVSIVDIRGRQIMRQKVAIDQSLTIDVSNLASGLYIVELRIDDQVGRKKIIKN